MELIIERVFAGTALAVCAVLLLRLSLGAARRPRFDRFFVRLWNGVRARCLALARWPRAHREARELADDAIRRASQGVPGKWDGNVYTPERFKKPPRDKMH